jgi:hypothetical protein
MSKRKRTAAAKRARRARKKSFMTIFIHGKQKLVPRPPLIDGLSVEEFLARNADPTWMHENELCGQSWSWTGRHDDGGLRSP